MPKKNNLYKLVGGMQKPERCLKLHHLQTQREAEEMMTRISNAVRSVIPEDVHFAVVVYSAIHTDESLQHGFHWTHSRGQLIPEMVARAAECIANDPNVFKD